MAGVTTRNNTALTSPSFQAEAQPLPPPQCFDTRHSTEPTHTHATGNACMYPNPCPHQHPTQRPSTTASWAQQPAPSC